MKTIQACQIKVMIEVSQPDSWERKIIAKAEINDTASVPYEQLQVEVQAVVHDARRRIEAQLAKTMQIVQLEEERRLIAERPTS